MLFFHISSYLLFKTHFYLGPSKNVISSELARAETIIINGMQRPTALIRGWLRAIRPKFLLASLIASGSGIALALWKYSSFDLNYALLTLAGVFSLHASIDLLNDYWDYKRGIDKITKRTKFSGGSGVIPEDLLSPKTVYRAAMLFLMTGVFIGSFFAVVRGPIIAFILIFAVLAIFFYSSKIVNFGLAELFVGIKGALVVVGSFYVQTSIIAFSAVFVGSMIGLLSSSVLLVNSFPDHDADRLGGRRTLVILLGKKRSYRIFSALVISLYPMIILGIFLNFTSIFSIGCFISAPYAFRAIRELRKNYEEANTALVPAMASTVKYSRITGMALVISMIAPTLWRFD
jgi:1,4-dihydroxy-2-naphthoate octaprenyltransferase